MEHQTESSKVSGVTSDQTIVPGRCHHCTMAVTIEQTFLFRFSEVKTKQIAFVNYNYATLAPLSIFWRM